MLTQGRQSTQFKVFFEKKLGHLQHGTSRDVQPSGSEMFLIPKK